MQSGLYNKLVEQKLLIPHEETNLEPQEPADAYKVIKPERMAFISYPYEWSFSALKDAALLTLRIQKKALSCGMTLKDASAYNIQFHGSDPIFIDTLSFERYEEGMPWVAYKQFCQHFLAPLALMAYSDVRLHQLLRVYLDGIPLDLASRLLPMRTFLRPSILIHIHAHARYQQKYADISVARHAAHSRVSKHQLLALVESLESAVAKLTPRAQKTEWDHYYEATNYTDAAFEKKKEIVERYIKQALPRAVWDMGANTGVFSRLATKHGVYTIAFDIDPLAVETNYRLCKKRDEHNMLPLVLDIGNPSPSMGWAYEERDSLMARGKPDMVLALALIHHLVITNNVPFDMVASFFASLGKVLIIEFVPKNDSNVERLLATRKDIFPHYTKETFEKVFAEYFTIEQVDVVEKSERILYFMRTRDTSS